MLAPKCATYHGRSTFANPKYLKKAQSDKPRLYEIPYDTSDPANRFCPDGEDTVTLENESRSKIGIKDKFGYVRFGINDQFASNSWLWTIDSRECRVKRDLLRRRPQSTIFSGFGQFCAADWEDAFRKSTCFVRDLQGKRFTNGGGI
ncbi:hypothetical protein Tco_1492082 [Tanacetum coccineum]